MHLQHLNNKEARCVAFSGANVDAAVARQLLCVVRPAAIEAAIMATQRQAQAHSEVLNTPAPRSRSCVLQGTARRKAL